MPVRRVGNTLERWEIALVKAMLARGGYNDQDILAHFTRPTRSVNHARVAEIRTGAKHRAIRAASPDELDEFLSNWPDIDQQTGLSLRGDELLVKAREAMIAAVHIFNGAGLHFRAELFIVTSVIAWTYLCHAYFKREGEDYRYYDTVGGVRAVKKTKNGADMYWELGACMRSNAWPFGDAVKQNLEFLCEIRHEIEHRSTSRIDDALSAKLQACCINFNDGIKRLFGPQYGLERRLPIALQFVTFDFDQRAALKRANSLPRHVETAVNEFHNQMTDEQLADPKFAHRVAFVQKHANRPSAADEAVEFVKPGSVEEQQINRVLMKEVEKRKYRPGAVVSMMQAEGFPRFNMTHHTNLWKELDAKDAAKGFGSLILDGQWCWYDTWVNRVRAHCQEHAARYS